MTINIGVGGVIGAVVGACLIPTLGPGAVPVLASLAGAGAGVGWQVSQAAVIHKVADKGIEILGKRSEEALHIFERCAAASIRTVERMTDTWSKFALAGTVAAGSFGLNYLVNTTADKTCYANPLALSCLHTTGMNLSTTLTTIGITFVIGAKACSLVIRENGSLFAKQNCLIDQRPSFSLAASDRIWEGYINVRGPDGRCIPVEKHDPSKTSEEQHLKSCVMEDEIWISKKTTCLHKNEDNYIYHAVCDFDYSLYGMIKIGRVWVDPTNQKDVEKANAEIKNNNRWCPIL